MSEKKSYLLPRMPREQIPDYFYAIQDQIQDLMVLRPHRFVWALASNWLIIALTVGLYLYFNQLWLLPLAMLVIGTRQHALAFLAHEGVHGNIVRNRKWNNRVAKVIAAWPIGLHYEVYKIVHHKHHLHINSEKDPDWIFFREWHNLPKGPLFLLKSFIPLFLGKGFIEVPLFQNHMQKYAPTARKIDGHLLLPLTLALLAIFSFVNQEWSLLLHVLGLWILPLFLVAYPLNTFRAMTEHYGIHDHDQNAKNRIGYSRSIQTRGWEHHLLFPMSVNRHLEHHLYDTVPFYNLEKLSALLMKQEDYVKEAPLFESYFHHGGVLAHLARK